MQPNVLALLSLVEDTPPYQKLLNELKQKNGEVRISLIEAAKPYFMAALCRNLRRPVLLITAQPENARKLYEQLMAWYPSDHVKLLPEPDTLPYERLDSYDDSFEIDKLQVLSNLAGVKDNSQNRETSPPLLIASAPAFIQKLTSYRYFAEANHTLEVGAKAEPLDLLRRWQDLGYRLENMVEVPGTMSRRGGIVDIYPPTSNLPARIEFFGNSVDSIRLFEPADQRSTKTVASITIGPATELLSPFTMNSRDIGALFEKLDFRSCTAETSQRFAEELAMLGRKEWPHNMRFYASFFQQDSLMQYLPRETLLVFDGPESIEQAVADLDVKAKDLYADKLQCGELPGGFPRPYFTWEEIEPAWREKQSLVISDWGISETGPALRLDFTPAPVYAGQLPQFIQKMKQLLNQRQRLIISSYQASRLSELLESEDILAPPVSEIKHLPPPGSLTLMPGIPGEGWVMKDTCLITDAEIFGFIKQRRPVKKRPVSRHKLFVDMVPGDYVVHVEHGIGKFTGVIMLAGEKGEKEYLVLEYAGNDKLYVPTDQIDRVARYVGAGEEAPALSHLGTQEWTRTKQRAKEAAAEVAQELLDLYATREVKPGFAFASDTIWQQEMEGSFPYMETPDQLEAVRQIKEDMEKTKPMDRLICGDVGYGKTEVAIRAAFKAVMSGKQVAVLVPTTVLAQQHYTTLKQRMEAFPLRVEVLSRFRSPKEQKEVAEGLANGSIDVCIGTHRLLQKDIVFKDLGLLIIDEEQRFGVGHKEHFKKMRQEVDVLTLSATPIPRTLHMSLVGVRDMSTMETPPEERLPIKTFVAEYDERLIREVVLREMERNGQVFFVHNRVQSIEYIASKLRELLPEARIAVGHGQMPEEQLEKVMTDFTRHQYDILLCTTIIESGLDLPNVNTMIINNADKLGLTQLYQLRGRIGRGGNLAYAYLLYEKRKHLTRNANQRLRTMLEATELGAGFGVAMKDLEIRGAGNLLGVKQSGHISAVGFNLYCQLLAQAVSEQKARPSGKAGKEVVTPCLPAPTVDLPLPAYIPEDYVPDLNTRLALYQKLVKLNKLEQLEPLANEFDDRFGSLPREVRNLLFAVKIKILATKAGIESVSVEDGEVVLRFFEGIQFSRKKLEAFSRPGIHIRMNQVYLNRQRLGGQWQKTLEEVVAGAG